MIKKKKYLKSDGTPTPELFNVLLFKLSLMLTQDRDLTQYIINITLYNQHLRNFSIFI